MILLKHLLHCKVSRVLLQKCCNWTAVIEVYVLINLSKNIEYQENIKEKQ